jgi:hypothetical protein
VQWLSGYSQHSIGSIEDFYYHCFEATGSVCVCVCVCGVFGLTKELQTFKKAPSKPEIVPTCCILKKNLIFIVVKQRPLGSL